MKILTQPTICAMMNGVAYFEFRGRGLRQCTAVYTDGTKETGTITGAVVWLAEQGIWPDTLLDLGDRWALGCLWTLESRTAVFNAFGISKEAVK